MTTSKRFLLASILVALVAAAVFVPGLGGGFIFDDRPNIVQNSALHISQLKLSELPFAAYSYQPGHGSRMLSMGTFALDYWRSGLNPRAFKVTNLTIHAITTVALAWLLFQLFVQAGWNDRRARSTGVLLAAAWALHPLQVSSVLYVVQRMQMLVTLFGILTLSAYLATRRAQIAGERSRQYALLALLFATLGFASKEDAVLYPAYTLAIELTLLHFGAKEPSHGRTLKSAYAALGLIGIGAFLFYVLPQQWHWTVVPGREFTSSQRLMTEARVLMMYLGQMLLPMPSHMPFYYDVFAVSKNLIEPATTLASIAALAAMVTWAWTWRRRHPIFSFGILLFFAGHALTSNILNLELAFEHRNQIPLIGIIIAVGELWVLAWERIERKGAELVVAAAVLCLLGSTTAMRAYEWGDPLRFARYSLQIAPRSPRAWMSLGAAYYELSRGSPQSPYFEEAIQANQAGASVTGSPSMYSNIVIYKSQRGDVRPEDWSNLLKSVNEQPMTLQNQFLLEIMLGNADNGIRLNDSAMVALIDAIAPRGTFSAEQYRRFGAYIHNETRTPEKAFRYLAMAVERAPPGDPDTERMLAELARAGRGEWVRRLRQIPRLGKHS